MSKYINRSSIIALFIPIFFFGYPVIANNLALYKFKKVFDQIEHPKNTQKVFANGEVTLRGNSDHCDLHVIEFREYSGDSSTISNFYEDMKISTYTKLDGNINSRVSVYSGERFEEFHWDKKAQLLLNKAQNITKKPIYVLSATVIYSDVTPLYLDLRCT